MNEDAESDYKRMKSNVMNEVKQIFKPEFLNRIDELIIFHTLKRDELKEIVKLQIKRIEKLLADQKIALQLTDRALDHVVEAGYDPTFGARPLKRAIQRELENPISTKILEADFLEGDRLTVDCVDGVLVFNKERDEALPVVDTAVEATVEIVPEVIAATFVDDAQPPVWDEPEIEPEIISATIAPSGDDDFDDADDFDYSDEFAEPDDDFDDGDDFEDSTYRTADLEAQGEADLREIASVMPEEPVLAGVDTDENWVD